MAKVDHIAMDTLRGAQRWLEPWYGAYALLGAVSSGLLPILLPLMMATVTHELLTVGYVIGAFNLGALSSPLWGQWADRRQVYGRVFFGGFILEMAALGAFPVMHGLVWWVPLALLMGAGSAAVATCAILFVVEFHPPSEWTPRIGWLQTFNGAGQVAGLLLAGLFASIGYRLGLWVGAGLLAVAAVLGGFSIPTRKRGTGRSAAAAPAAPRRPGGLALDFARLERFARVELLGGGLLKHASRVNLAGLKNITRLVPTRFGRFIASWFFVFFGVAGFFAYFPLFLRSSFGVPAASTSLAYAVAAGGGVLLYNLAGRWSSRFGAGRIYSLGRAVRLIGFLLMLGLMWIPAGPLKASAAVLAFGLVVLAWPVLSVTGTELTSALSPIGQGEAQGLNNAANAVATVVGTYLAGTLIHFAGYLCLPLLATGGLAISLLIDRPRARGRV